MRVPPPPLASICIPAYREEEYIPATLARLSRQTFFPLCEVVIGDYDPDGTSLTKDAVMDTSKRLKLPPYQIKVVDVDRSGIGYARAAAASVASTDVLMSFDADSYFLDSDSIERLVAPVLSGSFDETCCNNILPPKSDRLVADALYESRNIASKAANIWGYEPGLTMSRRLYTIAGGYPDVKILEGPLLELKALIRDPLSVLGRRLHLKDVYVVVSDRRANTVDQKLSLSDLTNYDVAFRGKKKLQVT